MAANFDGHKLIKTGAESLMKLGFNVGAKIVVVRRFTVDFDPKNKSRGHRKDIQVGTEVFIKGVEVVEPKAAKKKPDADKKKDGTNESDAEAEEDSPEPRLVISFEADFGAKLGVKSVDVAVHRSKFKLPDDSIAAAGPKVDPALKNIHFSSWIMMTQGVKSSERGPHG